MSENVLSYPIHCTPLGKQWQEWIKLWWGWCYGDRLVTSPVLDLTGELCGKEQVYDKVWFLAGTFGGNANRRCFIPNDRSLFFPILNDIVSFATDPQLKTEEELSQYAKADLDTTRFLHVVIDGCELIHIWKYRVRTPAFDLALPVGEHKEKYNMTRAVSDGYWLFLHPLGKGRHTIFFGGEKLDYDRTSLSYRNPNELPIFKVDVKYNLTVC
jgi:hypothetical protein